MIKDTQLQETPVPSIASNRALPEIHPISVKGGVVEEHGEAWYRIERTDLMESFLMSLISDSDHWLFITSSGALTAGRINPDHAFFPYYTQDKIEDMSACTGSLTVIRLKDEEGRTV